MTTKNAVCFLFFIIVVLVVIVRVVFLVVRDEQIRKFFL